MFFNFITYNKFKEKKWKKLSLEKRAEAFQALENIQAKKLDRPVYKVEFNEDLDESILGRCDNKKRIIQLNKIFIQDLAFRFLGMITLFHEGRHAFQYDCCFGDKEPWIFSNAYKWKKNFEGYVDGGEDKFSFYSMQPVERDACKYALKRLRSFRFRYGNELFYFKTYELKVKEFEDTKQLAKEELGIFYKQKVALRNRKERNERIEKKN